MNILEQFLPAYLEDLVGDRFGRFAKYTIQDRAIPDVRDGLKPVQRRVLYAMYDSGNTHDKPYRKSAKTVGDVMGNYHPHGDSSIYDAMVRMAQPWKMAHMLIDGHGNWGSIDDDPPAAMRYTEARLSELSKELLRDIEKRTVLFRENFDNTTHEPTVLPARYPNLLVNGVTGISTGFASEIPPHNLREVIDAIIQMIDNPQISLDELLQIIHGPDFPTGGIIIGEQGIRDAYRTGKGTIYIRAKSEIEEMKAGRQQIVITEIPYGVVKQKLVTAMEAIRLDKKVEGMAEVRDESGRDGLRIVIELKKDADAQGILTYLLKKTDLQRSYSFNMVAIVKKAPRQLGLVEMLQAYVEHQKDVVSKRTQFDLERALDRAHILEGLYKALNILDEVIQTIRGSSSRQDAQQNLVSRFAFTERQADAILTLQLYRLTNLEITSVEKELDQVRKTIEQLEAILASPKKLLAVIKKEILEIRDKYGINRRSQIQAQMEELKVNVEVLVSAEDVLLTFTNDGYIKRTSVKSFDKSGSDLRNAGMKEGDYIRFFMNANTLDQLLIFTERGQSFVVPVHQVPESKWKDNGTALVNVVQIDKEDRVIRMFLLKDFNAPTSVLFVTSRGQVKRTALSEYQSTKKTGMTAIKLNAGDVVVEVMLSDGNKDLLLISQKGWAIRFTESDVNEMGRNASGVRGIKLADDDAIAVAMLIFGDEGEIATITNAGYGKSSLLLDYPIQRRDGRGVQTYEFKDGKRVKSNGTRIISAFFVREERTFQMLTNLRQTIMLSSERLKIEERRAPGKLLAPLEKGEEIIDILFITGRGESE
jgi:topoisomerase-4 subunit A